LNLSPETIAIIAIYYYCLYSAALEHGIIVVAVTAHNIYIYYYYIGFHFKESLTALSNAFLAGGDREGFLIDKARGRVLSHVYVPTYIYWVTHPPHVAAWESYLANDGDDNYITYTVAICVCTINVSRVRCRKIRRPLSLYFNV